MDRLQDAMRTIVANGNQIELGTEEIHRAADDLARRAEQQAAAVEQTAAAIGRIGTAVNDSTRQAKRTGELVDQARADGEVSGKGRLPGDRGDGADRQVVRRHLANHRRDR